MDKTINLKHEKDKKSIGNRIVFLTKQLNQLQELNNLGQIEDVFIIGITKDKVKFMASNGLYVSRGKEMAKDFINNTDEYN